VLGDFNPEDRDSVTVIPQIINEVEMTAQFAGNDVFLMPSLSEGSPLSLIEAMATMMPVVAACVGGIPDIIEHEQSGLLFDPLDVTDAVTQVCRLLADPALCSRLGHSAQQRARALSWNSSAKTVESSIKTTLAQTRRLSARPSSSFENFTPESIPKQRKKDGLYRRLD
jgi:glycosyltransferase involved in cell wall biosynthesis